MVINIDSFKRTCLMKAMSFHANRQQKEKCIFFAGTMQQMQ